MGIPINGSKPPPMSQQSSPVQQTAAPTQAAYYPSAASSFSAPVAQASPYSLNPAVGAPAPMALPVSSPSLGQGVDVSSLLQQLSGALQQIQCGPQQPQPKGLHRRGRHHRRHKGGPCAPQPPCPPPPGCKKPAGLSFQGVPMLQKTADSIQTPGYTPVVVNGCPASSKPGKNGCAASGNGCASARPASGSTSGCASARPASGSTSGCASATPAIGSSTPVTYPSTVPVSGSTSGCASPSNPNGCAASTTPSGYQIV